MTNAVLTKRIAFLEREVQSVKSILSLQQWALKALQKKRTKPLPRGLRTAIKEVAEGKVSESFDTVDGLMTHLHKK